MTYYFSYPMLRRRGGFHKADPRQAGEWQNCDEAELTWRLDAVEQEEAYKIFASVPGLSIDDLDIEFSEDILKLSGEFKSEFAEDEQPALHERPSGKFSRTVRFNKPIKAEGIQASLKNGVLTLTLPKAEAAIPRKIVIKAE